MNPLGDNDLDHPLYHRLQQALDQRQRDRLLRSVELPPECRWNLMSNDYLQLRHHPDVLAGARQALESDGAGSGASPLLGGFLPCHRDLLEKLLKWKQKSSGLLFNTGFTANQAVLRHLPGPMDLVLADRLIHHSMAQALKGSRARFRRYRHLDLDHLEEMLVQSTGQFETVFVVTESVFSMDGDYPDLRRLTALKRTHGFILVLDEAHGTGVLGPTGAGLAEETGVLGEVDILVGTLGKALASMGAYVLSPSATVIDYLVNFSGEFIYSTYLGPAQAGAAAAALPLVQQAAEPRRHLLELSRLLRGELRAAGWPVPEFDSPIVPLVIGDPEETMRLRDHFLSRGILLAAVRPPTVPEATARLRISLHSGVTRDAVQEILEILKSWRSPKA